MSSTTGASDVNERQDNPAEVSSGPLPALSAALSTTLPLGCAQWEDITLQLDDLPRNVTARDIWGWFSHHGTIVWLSVYTLRQRQTTRSCAKIRFSPPPQKAFWTTRKYVVQVPRNEPQYDKRHEGLAITVRVAEGSQQKWTRSRLHQDRTYPKLMKLDSESLGFGALTDATSMKVLKTVHTMPEAPIRLEFNASSKRFFVFFSIPAKNRVWKGLREYKFTIDVTQMKHVYRTELPGHKTALVLPLTRPPHYFWKQERPFQLMQEDATTWSLKDQYCRATDIAEDLLAPIHHPVAIHTPVDDPHYMEIGRWTTFRFVLPNDTEGARAALQHLQDALEDFNIQFITCPVFQVSSYSAQDETIWSYMNHTGTATSYTGALALLEHSMSRGIHLAFEVRYQLEVCISRGFLNEYAITLEFLEQLEKMPPIRARLLLEYLADQGKPLHEPMRLFSDPEAEAYQPHLRIPHYCTLIRKAVVTPTTIRFSTANPEMSNRVFRRYVSLSDRFLRVQFVEESEQSKVFNKPENEALYERVLRTLYNGIQIGDRKYEFLAFGSSQLRECGAYFFCPSEHTSCNDIRKWMGQFDHIKVVAKYAARLGQCFSTTREIRGIHMPDIQQIEDVERHGLCFTDGVGKISKFLTQLIIGEMDLDVFDDPSAFQFRMGGCKGVLAVWPEAKGKSVHIRESQIKFQSEYNGLEIVRCAAYATATLNRQTITILESLGVSTMTFTSILENQLERYERSMKDTTEAIKMLTQFVDENQTTLIIAELLKGHFKTEERQEPFVKNILNLWRAWSLKLLKEKARLHVEQSAFVLGCVDETGSLRGHDSRTEGSKIRDANKLPQIFLQLSDPKSHRKTHIIEGICIVGRNPSLHPGDIRVVQAVNEPKLRHLKDVVVFPMTGDKPVPSMLSGGDLDGDDFFVIWNKHLIPMEWNHPPMDYVGPKPKELMHDVTVDQLKDFFVSHMKNDVLGVVAYAHLAHADAISPKHPTCLKLAEMHSKAVDFAKTGEPVGWHEGFQPKNWPHFMDQKKNIYRSHKALGQIYDKVSGQNLEFIPDQQSDFDQRIITKFELDNDMLKTARDIKMQYDMCVRRILAQHALGTEFELWTGFAMSKPATGTDYKRQEQLGREYDAIKQRFRELCYEAAGGHVPERIEPFVAAIYRVTEEDMKAGSKYDPEVLEGEDEQAADARKQKAIATPLISFPWIFHWVLIRIALGDKYKPSKNVMGQPSRGIRAPVKIWPSGSDDQKPLAVTLDTDTLEGSLLDIEQPRKDLVEDAESIPRDKQEVLMVDDAPGQSSMNLLAAMGME